MTSLYPHRMNELMNDKMTQNKPNGQKNAMLKALMGKT